MPMRLFMKSVYALLVLAILCTALLLSYFFNFPFDMRDRGYLYQARTIVTGQRDATRIPGFERCIEDVVKKLSGDQTITSAEVLGALAEKPQDYVKEFSDHDRMADIPIHDEQGTRDRPFDLLVSFHPAKIDTLLQALGRKAWTTQRPTIAVFLTIENGTNSYLLTGDEERGFDQRDSFIAAAWQAGIPMVLPTSASLNEAGLTPETVLTKTQTDLDHVARTNKGDLVLTGSIVWNSGMLGWKGDWQLLTGETLHRWQIRDVNFDDAFRSAMRGTAQILSGHGDPP